MSIVTKRGDTGQTTLMYNRPVPKSDPRIEACGSTDEFSAAIGLARSMARTRDLKAILLEMQKDLTVLMGELATDPADRKRYASDGFQIITADHVAKLDNLIRELESRRQIPKRWSIPGGHAGCAALHVARAACRRAERRVCRLHDDGCLPNSHVLVYLNRLSDALWLLAVHEELDAAEQEASPPVAANQAGAGHDASTRHD